MTLYGVSVKAWVYDIVWGVGESQAKGYKTYISDVVWGISNDVNSLSDMELVFMGDSRETITDGDHIIAGLDGEEGWLKPDYVRILRGEGDQYEAIQLTVKSDFRFK